MHSGPITTLFLDIGGFFLTNGWERSMRARAAEQLRLDVTETDERHHLTFDTYEVGKVSLDDYLDRVTFYRARAFSREEFRAFMFSQSQPYPEMIQLVRDLKARYGLKVAVISNKGRELTVHRNCRFELGMFVDFFIASRLEHSRKPDPDIYRLALAIAQVALSQVTYIEDRAVFVEAQPVSVRKVLEEGARELYPGYFALIMATGIVSLACFLHGFSLLARPLLQVNMAAARTLTLLTVVRLVRYLPQFMADLRSHTRAPGFFTLVAASCTLGSQFIVLEGILTAGFFLWFLGILFWIPLMYAVLPTMMVREIKLDLGAGLDGGWLIAVVATQSISVLRTQIAPHLTRGEEPILFVSLAMFLLGATLYLLIIALIFYRLLFFRLAPAEFTPSYWINMGATAITTLAGATLILTAPQWQFLEEILPFLKEFTLLFCVTGTWWIPLLFVLEVWRHVYRQTPFHYAPEYWGLVFPLGMYATSALELAKATGLSFLSVISHAFVYISLLTWAIAFLGLVQRLWSSIVISPVSRAEAS